MAHRFGIRLIALSLFITSMCLGFGKKTFIAPRSVSCDAALGLVGWQPFIYQCLDDNYHVFSITPTYIHSFDTKKITHYLFGETPLVFTGSLVPDRQPTDILADYFGLPSDYSSLVVFDPHILNFMMRLDWYYGLDCLLPGLFTRFTLPIVQAKWDLFLHECIVSTGTNFQPAGYMGPSRITRDQLAPNVEKAFQGKTTFGDMQEPLQFGKIFGRENMTRASELLFDIGYLIAHNHWYHAGIIMRAGAPIGNRATPEFLFQPTIGNGHHWEWGGGLTGHVTYMHNECTQLSVWSEIYITHLFGANLLRSFDFINQGSGSRYMLIESFSGPALNLNVAIDTPASEQYLGRLVPAINKTTLKSKISIPMQLDWVIKCAWRYKQFEFDCGYDLWVRSSERLHERDCFPEQCFGFKGDAQLYGFNVLDEPIALSPTESQATIHAGQGNTNFVAGVSFQNLNIDNPVIALDGANIPFNQLNTTDSAALGIAQMPVRTSNPIHFITNADIDEKSGLMPRAISHKFFVHGSYIGESKDCIQGYLGGGGSVEFGHLDPCKNSALSQWSIWAKGGISFN